MPRRRNPNGYPPPPGTEPTDGQAPAPVCVPKKDRWAWAKWIGGGIVLGIAGWEGLRWWQRIRGVRNPAEGSDEQPRQLTASSIATPQLPQVIPFPMPVPQIIPIPGMMNPFGGQQPPQRVVDDDDDFEELADRKRTNKARRAKRMAAIMEAFEEDDD